MDAETRAYLDDRLSELRRHFGVLTEDVRADIRAVAEGVALNTEAIGRLAAEMNARFASAEALNQVASAYLRRQVAEVRRDVAQRHGPR